MENINNHEPTHDDQMRENARRINDDVNRWREDVRYDSDLLDLMTWAN